MFIPARKGILRWGTPDPSGDWMMEGHLIEEDGELVLIDPPLVPGLIGALQRIGKTEAVILTTLDHTRGAKYIAAKTGAPLYIPDQGISMAFDPDDILKFYEIREFEKYSTGDLFGLSAYRVTVEGKPDSEKPWLDEFALLTQRKELIVGDIAIGTPEGRVVLAPEWFPHDPPHEAHGPAHKAFRKIVAETDADTLLASHGCNVYGTLKESLNYLSSP